MGPGSYFRLLYGLPGFLYVTRRTDSLRYSPTTHWDFLVTGDHERKGCKSFGRILTPRDLHVHGRTGILTSVEVLGLRIRQDIVSGSRQTRCPLPLFDHALKTNDVMDPPINLRPFSVPRIWKFLGIGIGSRWEVTHSVGDCCLSGTFLRLSWC